MSRKGTPKTFEDAMTRLEEITQTMQNTGLSLEESLAAYEEGVKLVAFCQEKLQQVEQKLTVLDKGILTDLRLNNEDDKF